MNHPLNFKTGIMKRVNNVNRVFSCFLVISIILTYGCSTSMNYSLNGSSHNLPYGMKEIDGSFWWKCEFKVVWPEDVEPDFAVDLLLAHAVVSPILSQYADNISYWRFHRRAVRDNGGHLFTFLFYSKPEIASLIFRDINKNQVLKDSLSADLIEKVKMDNPDNPMLQHIEDTSDPEWPPEVQKNWPAYIMGVSSFWLGLIAEYKQNSPEEYNDVDDLLEGYRQVNDTITEIWKEQGQHALFHHMNALFGYEPILIKTEVWF